MRQERDIAKEWYAVPAVPVYPFIIIEEWLRNERERESFLDAAYESGSVMEKKKETVRRSREHYGHPVPDPEFFGY